MYILIVARNFPKENEPLQGIFEFDQAKALQNIGHKVVYLSLDMRSIRRKRKLGKYWIQKEGIKIINISVPLGRIPNQIRLLIGKRILKAISGEIAKKQGIPDIIHAHFTGIALMASVLKEKLNTPLVITEHSSKITEQPPSLKQNKLIDKAYSNADCIVAVSTLLANNIKRHWNFDSKVVHNVVDTTAFSFVEKKTTKFFNFISIGNLIPRKGFDVLIEAFQKANFNKTVSLKIIGKGPEHKKLQTIIDKSEQNDQIELLGFLNRTEISRIMNDCDAFVLASRRETFGVVYIEAMLAGLPVVATACGGPEDFVTPENGLLVPVDNVIALKEALIKIHDKIEIYNKKGISENCKKNFSPENIADELTNIYIKTLSNG